MISKDTVLLYSSQENCKGQLKCFCGPHLVHSSVPRVTRSLPALRGTMCLLGLALPSGLVCVIDDLHCTGPAEAAGALSVIVPGVKSMPNGSDCKSVKGKQSRRPVIITLVQIRAFSLSFPPFPLLETHLMM